MAKVRSPNYPMLDFGAALQAARKAYTNDHRNKMSRIVLAKHLGHDSLSGPALGKIGALRAYGLIEGNGDELRITNDAVHALEAPEGSAERAAAISQMALRPKLFQEIRKEFPGPVSTENLRFWLIKRDFVPEAAEKAAKTYLNTIRLVEGGPQEYDFGDKPPEKQEPSPMTPQTQIKTSPRIERLGLSLPESSAAMLQEVFNLDEGPVTLIFPSNLSPESYGELEDGLQFFLRRAKRRAEVRAQYDDPEFKARREEETRRRASRTTADEE